MTAKVLWHVPMSLDGFIAGPADAIERSLGHGRHSPAGDELIAATGAILAGRSQGALFVLAHRQPDASPYPETAPR